MEDLTRLCFNCMRETDEEGKCPHCGADHAITQNPPLLPLGTLLSDRYYIGRVTRKNSEGITYIAYDNVEGLPCSVREFFPEALAVRDADGVKVFPAGGSENTFEECKDTFLELWKKLQRLKGLTSLIQVTDVFTADNTAYAVFAETEEHTLRDYLLSTPQGYIEWEQARILFMPVLSTLGTLHTSGVIHKGINPSAFIFTEDGKLKLSDFSIHQARLAYSDLEADIVDGYAPLEIYSEDDEIGPWTDIYSFSAVLYRSLIGSTPISAPVRAQNDQMMIPAKFAEKLPPYVINALINGMQINAFDRTRNVEQLRSNLSASPRAISASANAYRNAGMAGSAVRVAPSAVVPDRMQTRLIDALSDDLSVGSSAAPKVQEVREKESADVYKTLEDQKNKEKNRKLLTVLLVVLIIVLLSGIGLIVSSLFGGSSPRVDPVPEITQTQEQYITVPDFSGQIYDNVAHDDYFSRLLHIVKVDQYSATVPVGQIINQSVPANTQLLRNADITLFVSAGPQSFDVPDVSGLTYEQALAILAQRSLVCVRASKYNDGTHEPGTVAETVPAAGKPITQGDQIQVVLWSEISPDNGADDETSTENSATGRNNADENGRAST